MAFGLDAPGTDPLTGARRSLADYRDQIREIVSQGLVDIMLMSASTSELLTVDQRLFDGTTVTPAVRANDTTDIHVLAGAAYPQQPSRPFRTATIEQITRAAGVDVGLYSLTPPTMPSSTSSHWRRIGTSASRLNGRVSGTSSSCSRRTRWRGHRRIRRGS